MASHSNTRMVATPPLACDLLVAIAGVAVLVHLVFKRTETHEPVALAGLLIAVPIGLSTLYSAHCGGSIAPFILSWVTYWTTLILSILLYRISPFHPLASYPGPLACRVSKIHMAKIASGGKQHLYYHHLHETYGDVVRVGPNELSIRDVNAVVPVSALPKGTFWEGRIPENESVKPLIALRDKREHARRRKPWTKAFSTSALKGYEPSIVQRCTQLVDAIGCQKGPVDLTKWIGFWSYDVMNDLAFGGGTDMIKDGDVNGLWHLLEAGQKNSIVMGHLPWLGSLFLRFPNFANELKAFRTHAKTCALHRKQRTSPYKDLFYYLIDEDGMNKHPPSVVEVINDGGLAIIAGSDTTSSAVTNLFYFLLQSPNAFKRLQTEVDSLREDIFDFAKQAHLPYLNGALNESLRLLPPVLSGSQRAPENGSGGASIASYFIPEGTNVFVPSYSIHRDPRYFSPLPDAFLPERWLPLEQRGALEPDIFNHSLHILNSTAFAPFSTGTAGCAGKSLAWMEMRMLICLIMQRYEIRMAHSYNPEQYQSDMKDYFIMLKGELPVVLTPRARRSGLVFYG